MTKRLTETHAFAPAKINLALHVTGRRADGFHLLDSLVVFGDIGDRISARISEGLSLKVTGPMAKDVPGDDSNLVLRAADLLRERRGVSQGAALTLEKHLPHGAGIGGGSADGAATIKALAELWGVAPLSADEALPLGADLPVCLAAPQPMRMRGIGDVLEAAPPLPPFWLVLVNPAVTLHTARVFTRLANSYEAEDPPLDAMPDGMDFHGFVMWLLGQANSLTKCAVDICPEVAQIISAFYALETCEDCDMSGSGSTCWGLFETRRAAEAAAQNLSAEFPAWWVKVTAILPN